MILSFWLAFGLGFGGDALASCGLERCPIYVDSDERFAVRNDARITVESQTDGWVLEDFVGGRVRLQDQFELSAAFPLVVVSREVRTRGLGNGIVYADWDALVGEHAGLGTGVQLELPTSTDAVLGDSHFLTIPYLRMNGRHQSVDAVFVTGWARTLGTGGGQASGDGHDHDHHHGDHGHSETVPAINPHTESEILFRGHVGWMPGQSDGRIRPALGIDMVHELVSEQNTNISGLAQVDIGLDKVRLRVHGLVPVSDARRYVTRFGVTIVVPI